MKKLFERGCPRKKHLLVWVGCLVLSMGIFGAVSAPWVVGAASAVRQLPIYCVQRDQKVVSISFDAAWGNAK